MTKKMNPPESEMLQQVRRWRREAYQAERARSQQERTRRQRELADRYGLQRAGAERTRFSDAT